MAIYSPDLLFIEMTKACDYSCLHCRASSIGFPSRTDLGMKDVDEIINSIGKIAEVAGRTPHVILTGGDPLMSPSFRDTVSALHDSSVGFSVSPAVTEKLNTDMLSFLMDKGMNSMSISLDGQPEIHDEIRKCNGLFRETLFAMSTIKDFGIKLQINSTVMRRNLMDFPFILKILREYQIRTWEVFFLIATGRGKGEKPISSIESEDFLKYLLHVEASGTAIRTVEAPEYRRLKQMAMEGVSMAGGEIFRELIRRSEDTNITGLLRARTYPTNGRKIKTAFISSNGDVSVSGLFNLKLGSIRETPLHSILEDNEILMNIESGDMFRGKCGRCRYRKICGGSRARAFSEKNDYLESDSLCAYSPEINEDVIAI